MKIVHTSDTHGYLWPVLPEGDAVIHSGDFCPNRTNGIWAVETTFQPAWIQANGPQIKDWIGERPFGIVHGNHDFIDTVPYLKAAGIDAYNLDDKKVEILGVGFQGFPWVPEFGPWNRGLDPVTLYDAVFAMDLDCDVLVCHAPIYGVLDRNRSGERCGNKPLRKLLQDAVRVPDYVLCGHIHESNGYQAWSRGISVSNAATTVRVIDV